MYLSVQIRNQNTPLVGEMNDIKKYFRRDHKLSY